MLNEEDKALWDAYCKTVVPLEKASKFKVFSHKLSKCIPFVRKIKSSVPVVLDLHGFTVQEAYSIFIRFFNHHLEQNTKTIIIEGMQCNHCKMTVEKVLNAIEGVTNVEVNLEKKVANIEASNDISNEKIKEVILEAGFEVKEII